MTRAISNEVLDSDLAALAALSTTAFGRALLALVDAPALRTAAGLGTAATANTTAFDAAGAAAAAQAASQPVDSDLTAIAALSTTAFGRSLLEAANAAALRTLAGLGSAATSNTGDFQAADAELAAIAALTSAADRLPYFTGPGTASLATFTAAGRALVDDADAAAQRTTLGLGTAATVNTGVANAGDVPLRSDADARYAPLTPTVGSSLGTTGTVNLDLSTLNGTYQTQALTGNITYTTSNLVAGRSVTLKISAAAQRTFTFPAGWVFLGAAAPANIAAGKTAVLTLTAFGTTDADVVAAYSAQP